MFSKLNKTIILLLIINTKNPGYIIFKKMSESKPSVNLQFSILSNLATRNNHIQDIADTKLRCYNE